MIVAAADCMAASTCANVVDSTAVPPATVMRRLHAPHMERNLSAVNTSQSHSKWPNKSIWIFFGKMKSTAAS